MVWIIMGFQEHGQVHPQIRILDIIPDLIHETERVEIISYLCDQYRGHGVTLSII